jgi:RNA polymerase sigma-70 factor (ECF subfamily)
MTSASPRHDPEPSRDLVERARAGDRAAFDDLIRRNERRLASLVAARLGRELRSVEESGDVIQSALGEAVRALQRFEYRGEGSFLRWLSTLVENKVRHHLRDLHREKRGPAAVTELVDEPRARDPSPSEAARGAELERSYHDALERMPPDEKELLLLHLEIGCTNDEIAGALGIGSGEAVRKRISRALVRLQQHMQHRGRA